MQAKKYTFDIKFVGYEQVTVEAESLLEAREKASDYFDSGMNRPLHILTTKSFSIKTLGSPTEEESG